MGGGTEALSPGRDTAGQERYQTITKQYYRRAQVRGLPEHTRGKPSTGLGCHRPPPQTLQGIFLVYDISSERSYQHIVKWASDVDEVGVHEGGSGGSPAVFGGVPYTAPPLSTHLTASRKSSSGTRRTRSTRGKCPKSKGCR